MAVIFDDQVCFEPSTVASESNRVGIPTGEWQGRANRFHCPNGVDPGDGDILLSKHQLDQIDQNVSHELEFSDPLTGTKVPLARIHIRAAQNATPGKPDDPTAIFHVKVSDIRRIWTLYPLDRGFNCSQTPGAITYSRDTSNVGVAYTWAQIWAIIWNALPHGAVEGAVLGGMPDLPTVPDGTPQNLDYFGMTVPEAMRDFLQRLGLVLCYDPVADKFTLATPGEEQAGLANELENRLGQRLHDGEPIQPGLGRFPSTVRVLFPKRPEAGWGRDPWVSVDIDAPTTPDGTLDGTTALIRDDLNAIMAANTCTNKADLLTRAAARASEYFQQIQKGQEFQQLVYSGAYATILPGSEITSVVWEERGGGIKTEVVRQPHFQRGMAKWLSNPTDERWRLVDHVWVFDSVYGVTAPAGYKPAQAEHFDTDADTWVYLFPCWFREQNGQTAVVGRHLVRFAGQKDNGARDIRPAYAGGCCPDGTGGDGPVVDDPEPTIVSSCCPGYFLPAEFTIVLEGTGYLLPLQGLRLRYKYDPVASLVNGYDVWHIAGYTYGAGVTVKTTVFDGVDTDGGGIKDHYFINTITFHYISATAGDITFGAFRCSGGAAGVLPLLWTDICGSLLVYTPTTALNFCGPKEDFYTSYWQTNTMLCRNGGIDYPYAGTLKVTYKPYASYPVTVGPQPPYVFDSGSFTWPICCTITAVNRLVTIAAAGDFLGLQGGFYAATYDPTAIATELSGDAAYTGQFQWYADLPTFSGSVPRLYFGCSGTVYYFGLKMTNPLYQCFDMTANTLFAIADASDLRCPISGYFLLWLPKVLGTPGCVGEIFIAVA